VTGAAYIYVDKNGTWIQHDIVTYSPTAHKISAFGYAVSMSGATAIIGAYEKSRSIGAAYVFLVL
jgi:FG-GAP repeat